MLDMNIKLDTWKNKLLDMGKRNRLLNYRDTRRSSLRIINPDIYTLWDSFVLRENSIEFPFAADEQAETGDAPKEAKKPANSNGISTNMSVKDQQRTLRNLRNKAKTIMEEQGVNVLYLSFGFLRWSESEDSRSHQDSPLILVPVTISWESITSPFVLSLHEDEIVVNPTLIYKLENDFGIKLPEFNSEGDIRPFLEEVEQIVSSNQWEVIGSVGLSLLSFLKINMYRDLENHRDVILNDPVVRALSGDASAIEHDLGYLENFDYDNNLHPEDTFNVVDADSSQMDAILCARQGVSFVLQGPPGTGKSQTITNIIAESLAAGKKVLFVSEKKAALDVVYKRLSDANLADFCLILHSHKANKKDTLAQLGSVLTLAQKKASLSEEAYQKLIQMTSDRKRLNDYVNAIHTVIEPFHKTIFEVNGLLASVQGYEEIIFAIPNVRQLDARLYSAYINGLTRYSDTIDSMSSDYRTNPWRGANVKFVSNELRHDIGANLGKAIPKAATLTNLADTIQNDLSIRFSESYNGLRQVKKILEMGKQSPKVPVLWFGEFDLNILQDEIRKCAARLEAFKSVRTQVESLQQQAYTFDPALDIIPSAALCTTLEIDECLLKISDIISGRSYYSLWDNCAVGDINTLLSEAAGVVGEYNSIFSQLSERYEKEIFSIDYNAIYLRYKAEYTSALKIFNSQYRKDKKLIQSVTLTRGDKLTDNEIFNSLVQLRRMDELKVWLDEHSKALSSAFGSLYNAEHTDFEKIEKYVSALRIIQEMRTALNRLRVLTEESEAHDLLLREHFGTLYRGIETDWNRAQAAVVWAKSLRQELDKLLEDNSVFAEYICVSDEKIYLCSDYSRQLELALTDFDKEFSWFTNLFDSPTELLTIKLPVLAERMQSCVNNLYALEDWIDFRTIRSNCIELGMEGYILKVEELNISADQIIPIFQKRLFRLWLDSVMPEFPVVAGFRRRTQESIVKEFNELDKMQFSIAKSRIRTQLINSLPSIDHFTSGVDEISILKRELNKQRRIMPIRLLFKKIPNLIMTLKPRLMMSPLSVSLFLESESFRFDTVIFDEASQVCTENAIGAIIRGKQVIIAGDSKQLPPTNFFAAAVSDSDFDDEMTDDEEFDDSNAYESILDEASLLPERTLLWHYRSRHEHLIAFSNAKIYRNNLITFPSNVDRLPDVGVEYVYVPNGFYDRGGRRGNTAEAQKVAELVFEHIRKFPNRSLGVIAFGEVQALAIDAAIRKMRIENQQYEDFFNEDLREAFFTKSLENVQGDERDTIIFSIGYAKDASGVMRMQFGPLSQTGGERRLNVAITRAKYNVKLVGSILPTDIVSERINAEGPKLLRSYIDFAINGPSVLLNEASASGIAVHDSPFEESVYNFLERKGYKVDTQVGCSGYRIDMAVKHPTLSGRYVLGIECDGATYHSARTARERDRLRQDVLESMGWKIYRIWSTDWIKDPITEGQYLVDAVEKAISEYVEFIPEPVEESAPAGNEPEEFITVETKGIALDAESNPYNFTQPKTEDFSALPRDRNGYLKLADCIELVVKSEYPVHYDLLCQRLCKLFGREKATSVVRREVDYALKGMASRIERKEDFFYPSGYTTIPIYGANGRAIKYISIDELGAAMIAIAQKCVGATRESLIEETTRAYGFNRKGANIANAMAAAYDKLLRDGNISERDNKVVLSEPNA